MSLAVGIVGWGDIAAEHARQLRAAGARLAGVMSRRQDLSLDVPVYDSVDELLRHVDAITVAVPNHLHAAVCLAAVPAGKAVMVEKPLLISSEELADLETALLGSNPPEAPVHLGYRLRWNPSMRRLRDRLEGPRRIHCVYHLGIEALAGDTQWTGRLELTGGSFFTLGVHTLDLARWLAGCRGEELADLEASAETYGRAADYPLNVRLRGTLPNGVEIVAGADLSVECESRIDLRVEADGGGYPDPSLPPPEERDEPVEYKALIANFVEAVKAGEFDSNELGEVIQTHRELLAARQLSHPQEPPVNRRR